MPSAPVLNRIAYSFLRYAKKMNCHFRIVDQDGVWGMKTAINAKSLGGSPSEFTKRRHKSIRLKLHRCKTTSKITCKFDAILNDGNELRRIGRFWQ